MTRPTAAVVGQLARDLVLSVDRLPDAGSSGTATGRLEQLGGKGANQAVALAQLGVRPSLVAVAGDDVIGDVLLSQAQKDGIDVRAVVRRPGTLTGLIVELLTDGEYRYVEDVPVVTEAEVVAARDVIAAADAVLVQLQLPPEVALAAARIGHEAGRLVVLDGAVTDRRLLAFADVIRADEKEADGLDQKILEEGPSLLAIARADGNQLFFDGGQVTIPLVGGAPVDTTGGGDSFVAGLTAALLRGDSYEEAGRLATKASGSTVGHPGGRPDLRDV